jgi:hypothetical protein
MAVHPIQLGQLLLDRTFGRFDIEEEELERSSNTTDRQVEKEEPAPGATGSECTTDRRTNSTSEGPDTANQTISLAIIFGFG